MNCFDAAAFALPAAFTFGNAPRNVLRGPKSVTTDLSLMKNVPARRRRPIPVPRGDLQRVRDGQLWQARTASFNSASFGQISSAGSMRQVQLGARLSF